MCTNKRNNNPHVIQCLGWLSMPSYVENEASIAFISVDAVSCGLRPRQNGSCATERRWRSWEGRGTPVSIRNRRRSTWWVHRRLVCVQDIRFPILSLCGLVPIGAPPKPRHEPGAAAGEHHQRLRPGAVQESAGTCFGGPCKRENSSSPPPLRFFASSLSPFLPYSFSSLFQSEIPPLLPQEESFGTVTYVLLLLLLMVLVWTRRDNKACWFFNQASSNQSHLSGLFLAVCKQMIGINYYIQVTVG